MRQAPKPVIRNVRFFSSGGNCGLLNSVKSFDEYNMEALKLVRLSEDDYQVKKRSRELRLGEKLVDEFIESSKAFNNNTNRSMKEFTFEEGHLIPNEIWSYIEQDLKRIFECLRAPRNVDTSFELAIEVRNDLDMLKSICEHYNFSSLINVDNSKEEKQDVAKLNQLIIKMEEECELFELSEKIRELDIRLANLSTDNRNGDDNQLLLEEHTHDTSRDTFIKLEKPRILIKIVDLLERRYNLLKRMNQMQDAQIDLMRAISLLEHHIEQVRLGNHDGEGEVNFSRAIFWLNHLKELLSLLK